MTLSFLKSRNWLFLWRAHKDKLWLALAAVIIVMVMAVEPEEVVFMPPKITTPDEEKIMMHLEAMDRIAQEMQMRQPVDNPKEKRND